MPLEVLRTACGYAFWGRGKRLQGGAGRPDERAAAPAAHQNAGIRRLSFAMFSPWGMAGTWPSGSRFAGAPPIHAGATDDIIVKGIGVLKWQQWLFF